MKKILNYTLVLAAALVALASCKKEVEDVYTPGAPDSSNCVGVYFPTQEASGSHTFDPSMARTITVTASRSETSGDVSVPYTFTAKDANGEAVSVFNAPKTIDFADGQTETSFDITFDEAEEGINYSISLLIDDPEYAPIYGANSASLNFNVLIVAWVDFLNPVTNEPAVFTITSRWFPSGIRAKLKYYETGGIRTGVFTCIETEEDGSPVGIWGGDPSTIDLSIRWYVADQPSVGTPGETLSYKNKLGFDFVELPKQYFGYDYNDGDWLAVPEDQAATPIYVYDYFHYWVERGYSADQQYGSWLDDANVEGSPGENYPLGYYDGNGGFYFNIYFYIPGLGGWSPDNYGTVAIADGFVRVDYSLEAETDYSYDGITPVFVEAGADVDYIQYAVYEGELNATQAANKESVITDGTDASVKFSDFEFDEDENVKYATLELAPEASGLYTVVLVAYDKDKNPQNTAYVVINHVAEDDLEASAVVIDVFTEATPARYESAGFNEYNSFAFGISGTDITEAHVAIVAASSLSNSVVAALKADQKGTYAVDEATIAAINGVGGYYDVASGLDAGTEYAVLVWATNGKMEDFVYDVFTTTESPEVWEPYGTATWTDAFFGPWFSADPLTYDVALERSADDPARFRLVNVYGEAFPYNEPGDWDDSKDYYLVINTHDPDYVWFEQFDTGCNWGYGNFILTTQIARYIGSYDLDVIKENEIPGAVYANDKITFAPGSILKAMAEYNNGGWYYGNRDDEYVITFNPGATLSSAPAKLNAAKSSVKTSTLCSLRNLGTKRTFEREAQPVQVKASVTYTRKPAQKANTMATPAPGRKF